MTKSIPPIPIGESGRRVVALTLESLRGQPLSPAFTNPDIISGLVYEHTTVEPMVVQKMDERNTLLVFAEGENLEKSCQTLWSIKMWLGHSVHTGYNIATPKQMMREEGYMFMEESSTQISRLTSEPQCKISCPSVASQVLGKMPNSSTFSRDPTQRGDVSFEQLVFEVRSVTQSHSEVTL